MTLDAIRPDRHMVAMDDGKPCDGKPDDARPDDARPDGVEACSVEPDAFDAVLARIAEAPEVPLDSILAPGTEVGSFEVLELIGRGAFGAVYRAVHPLIGKQVAVKVLSKSHAKNPLFVRRFVEEARAVSRLRHPNIIDIFGFGELPDTTPYFVMELLPGKSLSALMQERRILPIDRVVAILGQVAAALEAAHLAGILHRDLKPANVFLMGDIDGEFAAKLLDFGIAKFLDASTQLTEDGVVIGTPGYMSPEQCAGEPLAKTSDIYSLGVLSFELLTGTRLFSRNDNARLLVRHLVEIPRPVSQIASHVPRALDAPVSAMLEKDPARRPQSATAAVDALRRALLAPPADRPTFWRKLRDEFARGATRRRRAYALGGVSLVAALWGGAVAFAPRATPEQPAAAPIAETAAPAPVPFRAPAAAPSTLPPEATPPVPEAKAVETPSPAAPRTKKAPDLRRRTKAARPPSARGELEY